INLDFRSNRLLIGHIDPGYGSTFSPGLLVDVFGGEDRISLLFSIHANLKRSADEDLGEVGDQPSGQISITASVGSSIDDDVYLLFRQNLTHISQAGIDNCPLLLGIFRLWGDDSSYLVQLEDLDLYPLFLQPLFHFHRNGGLPASGKPGE